jgi:phosphate transport system protein
MPTTHDGFNSRIEALHREISGQARRVQALIETAFDAAFARSATDAASIARLDEDVDRVDVAIERSAVALLTDATATGAALNAEQLRRVLTIVKVNNELERIADLGVRVGETTRELAVASQGAGVPDAFRVLTNSVIGILRDAGLSLEHADADLAKVVLASEDAVEAFKRALATDVQRSVAAGKMDVETALALQDIASLSVAMADHCTNIAEQVLYSVTGTIVRHTEGHWEEFTLKG